MSVNKVYAGDLRPEDGARILCETLDSLQMGETIEIIDNHNPSLLYNQLQENRPNEFEWNYLEEGPNTWKIAVKKKYLSFI